MDRDGGRAGPQRVQGDAGDVAHEIDAGAAKGAGKNKVVNLGFSFAAANVILWGCKVQLQ